MFKPVQKNWLVVLSISLMLCVPYVGTGQNATKQAARAAKVSPDLLNVFLKQTDGRSNAARQAAPPDTALTRGNRTMVRNGMIAIEAVSIDEDATVLLKELEAMGLTEGVSYKRMIFGYFPIKKVGVLQSVPGLRLARPAYKPVTNAGRVTSQGDRAMRADVARQTSGVTGAGQKVGILSSSYDALRGAAAGVASGDLPTGVQVLQDLPAGFGSDEGRAMAEIVHDVAPGASIAFNTAFTGQAGFARGILNLARVGSNVIVDDVGYLDEPFFQDGIVAQAANEVARNGVTYFSSAGNSARDSYTSPFINSGKSAPLDPFLPINSKAHDFGNGVVLQRIQIAPGGEFFTSFQWSDPFFSVSGGLGAKTDMDILVYYRGVLRPDLSGLEFNIGGDPVEVIDLFNSSNAVIEVEIALVKDSGPDPALIKWVNFGGGTATQFATRSSTIVGHANAEGAIAVGAARYTLTPVFSTTLSAPIIEGFSSAGGTPILFATNGQPVEPVIRRKPEIVGPDGGNTTFFPSFRPLSATDIEGDDFPNFFGTSASAPHAAGVGALLQEKARKTFTPAQVRDRLQATAIDMDDPLTPAFDVGFDFRTGFGFIQADRALTFGDPLVLLEPLYNCQTGQITLQTTGGDGTPIVFNVPGVQRSSPTSTTGVVEAGLRNDPKPITITATQNGVTVTYVFDFFDYCSRPRVLTLIAPLYDCVTGAITFRTTGGNGSPIVFTAPGVQRSSPTSPSGVVEAGLRNDPKPIMITATQDGVTTTYVFNFAAFCSGSARVATGEPTRTLEVTVMGNPNPNDWADVEIRGAQGHPLQLRLSNSHGQWISEHSVDLANPVERHRIRFDSSAGLYMLQVSTPTQTRIVKVIRQ